MLLRHASGVARSSCSTRIFAPDNEQENKEVAGTNCRSRSAYHIPIKHLPFQLARTSKSKLSPLLSRDCLGHGSMACSYSLTWAPSASSTHGMAGSSGKQADVLVARLGEDNLTIMRDFLRLAVGSGIRPILNKTINLTTPLNAIFLAIKNKSMTK